MTPSASSRKFVTTQRIRPCAHSWDMRSGRAATIAWLLRVASGAVFLIFGLAKFTSHEAEVDAFRSYGLPSPDTFVYVIGTLEVIGALFLFARLATRFTALVLAGNMAAAIVVSGLGEGELVSLTLAPALLISMLFLIRVGPGRYALGRQRSSGSRPGTLASDREPVEGVERDDHGDAQDGR